jgi:hypothetical protein
MSKLSRQNPAKTPASAGGHAIPEGGGAPAGGDRGERVLAKSTYDVRMELLAASLAALGAVIGFIFGATVGSALWWRVFGSESSDIPPLVIGGLGGAVLLAWLGLRLSRRVAQRPPTAS